MNFLNPFEKRKLKLAEEIVEVNNEKILYISGINPVFVYFLCILIIFLGLLYLAFNFEMNKMFLLINVLFILFLLFGIAFYFLLSFTYIITDKRLIFVFQFIVKRVLYVSFADITNVELRRDILQRFLFKDGNILINTAAGVEKEIVFWHVFDPEKFITILNEKIRQFKKGDTDNL